MSYAIAPRRALLSCGLLPESHAYFAQFTASPPAWLAIAVDQCLRGLKSCGAWNALELLYFLWLHDEQAARINARNPGAFTLTAVNSPAFAPYRGFSGDGATTYLDTGFAPNTNAVKWSLNSACLGVWTLTDIAANNSPDIGLSGGGLARISPRSSADVFGARVNDQTTSSVSVATSIGHFTANRSGAAARQFAKDGVEIGNDTAASTANAIQAVHVLHDGSGYSPRQVGVAYLGASLAGLIGPVDAALRDFGRKVGAVP